MKKIISGVLAIVLVLSLSLSVMAAGVAPAIGDTNIDCKLEDVTVKVRTLTVKYSNAKFDPSDDVTFLFYAPESAESDNIIDTNIYHADQVRYSDEGYTFTLSNDVPEGTYNLLIGGTDEDFPRLVKGIKLDAAVIYGDVDGNEKPEAADLLIVAQYLAGFDTVIVEGSTEYEAADVDWTGSVDAADLLKLAQYLAGFDVALEK